ncbi:nucleocytoplasmic transporter NUP145 Ecym_2236 [Eremothecium cymbalariae DBVPG|uniref:Peptidase S59 domain-containing protein n=1 Tax=Eremothecium cymbalariae (strain CBS 270.75 / DBVPG 7215 / KCTC 17166 / NRRL Y-17582) TaxID=931890 RepID=G8JPM8_ERECY|nr:Hypothetical protein Ecym_2236 [Eremothecium cymbalariae DBVPG\
MFGASSGGNSLFSGINTSTPTSTPTPANTVFALNQKPNGGVFGNSSSNNINNNNQNNVSTPSPSGGLFGNKLTSGTGLFNQTNPQGQQAGGLSGQGNNTSTSNPNTSTLFGSVNNATASTPSGGIFGNASSTNVPTAINPLGANGGSLFGNNTILTKNTSASPGGLFDGKTVAPSSAPNGGLFASSLATGTNCSTASSKAGVFDNKVAGGTDGNDQIFGRKPYNNLFGNASSQPQMAFGQPIAQQQNTQLHSLKSNPYGLQLTSVPVSTMPESITSSLEGKKVSEFPSAVEKKRTFSTSSAAPPPLLVSNQSTLISKLSSRLNSIKSRETTQGLFSPFRKVLNQDTVEASQRLRDLKSLGSNSTNIPQSKQFHALVKRADLSDMRKLKIDPNRSAAKKLRLLSGNSSITKVKVLGENRDDRPLTSEVFTLTKAEGHSTEDNSETRYDIEFAGKDNPNDEYWCSPSIEQLQKLPIKQLSAIPNFVIGRKRYGSISFDLDVDLTDFKDDFRGNLFGRVIAFNENKTVEVYPDDSIKPSIGQGLNVPATISLERIYPVEKRTNQPITGTSEISKVQYFVKRLKCMREMEFISYKPYGGIWTFKVKHFSIWGLINDSDVEVDEEELEAAKQEEIKQRIVAIPKRSAFAKNNDGFVPGTFDQIVRIPSDGDVDMSSSIKDDLSVNSVMFANFEENSEAMPEFLEEKPYEPSDVEEDDFEGLEVDPRLEVSSNWQKQLKLAGDSYKSVFAPPASLKKAGHVEDILFKPFKQNMEAYKYIQRKMKLSSHQNIAKFNNDSTLVVKGATNKSNWYKHRLASTLHTYKSSIDIVFKKSLKTAILESRGNNYPIIKGWSLTFTDIAKAYEKFDQEYRIWKLASVLFDTVTLEEDIEQEEVRQVLIKKQRYEMLCDWIVCEIESEIEAKLAKSRGIETIFLHLVKRDITRATNAAIASNNHHLAVLVTLLGSNDPFVRDLAKSQLAKWKEVGAKVDSNIVKIYQLLTGSPFAASTMISVSAELSWLANFGLQIFYGNIDVLSLEELVISSLKNTFVRNAPPKNDIVASILQLYCPDISPDVLIGNLKIYQKSLDVHLPWFFVQILSHYNISGELRDRITLQFVEQLKIEGMRNEALFVLCFLQDDRVAKQQVNFLISSEITFFSNAPNSELLSRLKIPENIYYQFLALYDKYNKNHLSEARNLLKAKMFSAAEKVVITNVAPRLILDGTSKNLLILHKLLQEFPSYEMDSWSKGLGIFEKYSNIVLDNNDDKELLMKLVNELPILFNEFSTYREVSVVCCAISKKVCHIFLEKYRESLEASILRDRLLALPLGQPETLYLKRSLASL